MPSVMRLYRYVGPGGIAQRVRHMPSGAAVTSVPDVLAWARATGQRPDAEGRVIATFVVDAAGTLRLADRRSEHVACAGGRPVRSAGEVTLALGGASVEVVAVSNQSTGFCPEPESFPAVAAALLGAGVVPPVGFDPACTFRRCLRCGSICLVKGGVFECDVCEAELPAAYNCQV
jgi:hypothetical protein